jgi:hypothetical protein
MEKKETNWYLFDPDPLVRRAQACDDHHVFCKKKTYDMTRSDATDWSSIESKAVRRYKNGRNAHLGHSVAHPDLNPDPVLIAGSGIFVPDPAPAIHSYLNMKKVGRFLPIP